GPSVSSVLVVTPDPNSARTVYCAANFIVHASGNGGDRWVPANSGIVGPVYDLAVHPSRPGVLLAFGSQLFKSTNGGRSWSRRDVRLTSDDSLYRVIWDGGRPNRVFLLTSKSLFLSLDEGDTWTDLSTALAVVPRTTFPLFSALAVDRMSGIVYAVTAGGGGVFRSDDPQKSWLLLSSPFENVVVRTILIHPLRSDTLYAATFSGFFRSEDGG